MCIVQWKLQSWKDVFCCEYVRTFQCIFILCFSLFIEKRFLFEMLSECVHKKTKSYTFFYVAIHYVWITLHGFFFVQYVFPFYFTRWLCVLFHGLEHTVKVHWYLFFIACVAVFYRKPLCDVFCDVCIEKMCILFSSLWTCLHCLQYTLSSINIVFKKVYSICMLFSKECKQYIMERFQSVFFQYSASTKTKSIVIIVFFIRRRNINKNTRFSCKYM